MTMPDGFRGNLSLVRKFDEIVFTAHVREVEPMSGVERNLDAYRTLSEILSSLRNVLRREIEKRHGKEWYRAGLPQPVLERLIERKEREQAIDWYENEYQELMDFAGFADILEILEANPDLLPQLKAVTPSAPLLHARMIELEVIREKLAMARTVGETELSFLATFHVRIHKALEQVPEAPTGAKKKPALQAVPESPGPVEESPEPAAPATSTGTGEGAGEAEKPEKAGSTSARAKPKRPKLKTKTRVGRSRSFGGSSRSAASSPAMETTIITEEELDEDEPEPQAPGKEEPPAAAATANALAAALESGDNTTVLRELYKEVTGLAEAIWTSEPQLTPVVWPRVREHAWYEERFTTLGLKPLSDFYEIVARVRERLDAGCSKEELQELLKEQSFAKVLLALRDMFQKNEI
jgi:hypothetical protein